MAKTVRIYGLKGMNNLAATPAALLDDQRLATPRLVLNADVAGRGVISRRTGYRKLSPGESCHSLWSLNDHTALYVAKGSNGGPALFRLLGETPVEVAPVGGPPEAPMVYLEVNSLVYLANGYWTGVYDPAADTVRPWGLPLPPRPRVNLVPGYLPPGRYSLCYTGYDGQRLGGNGPVATVEFSGDSLGIELVEQPPGTLAWITQADGGDFFLAPVEGGVINKPYYAQPLPTLNVIPAPAFTAMALYGGRIWGCAGNKLYYSREFRFEQFTEANIFHFTEELVLLAPAMESLFISSPTSTWHLKGTAPHKMEITRVGEGAIPGTLVMAPLEAGHYTISRPGSLPPTPVWLTERGFVAGSHSGHIVTLTQPRLRIAALTQGAALCRTREGVPQVLVSLRGRPVSATDPELAAIFARNRLCVPAPLQHVTRGGLGISGEGVLS